jgi:hypothetical protein
VSMVYHLVGGMYGKVGDDARMDFWEWKTPALVQSSWGCSKYAYQNMKMLWAGLAHEGAKGSLLTAKTRVVHAKQGAAWLHKRLISKLRR